MKKVSILIPAYNAERFLMRCIESILKQTYEELEIIVINDGSHDGTWELCNKYEKQEQRIQVIDQQNKGVAAARNVGLKNATGDYILFVDADDWIEPDMVERLMNAISEQELIDIAFCSHDNAETLEQVVRGVVAPKEIWNREKQQEEFLIHQRMTGMLWNKLIRAELFAGISFDETVGYGEDAQVLWKVLKHSRNMVVVQDVLYHHVLDDQSISHQKYSKNKYSAIKVWEEIEAEVNKECPQWNSLVQERLLATATYTYYEMKCSQYRNKEERCHLRKIVRQNIKVLFRKNRMTWKMKSFAIVIALGM